MNTFSCPFCQTSLEIPEHMRGREVHCPQCAKSFWVAIVAERIQAEPPNPPSTSARSRPPDSAWDDDRSARPSDDWYEDDEDWDRPRRRRRRRDWETPHRASLVLTLGIISLLLCGPILGPIAWALGHADLKEIAAGRMDPSGEGMTRSGMVCGMIGSILSIVAVAIWFFIFVVFATHLPR